jgi:hypothetical protein
MKKFLLVTALPLIFVVACGPVEKASTPSPTTTVTVTSTPTQTPSATPIEDPHSAKYGQAVQYDEGLKVTADKPKVYPKDPTVKMSYKYYWLFNVTLKNITKYQYTKLNELYGEVNGNEGDFTQTEGTGYPDGTLPAGEITTFAVVYGTNTPGVPEFSLAMTPMWEISQAVTWRA